MDPSDSLDQTSIGYNRACLEKANGRDHGASECKENRNERDDTPKRHFKKANDIFHCRSEEKDRVPRAKHSMRFFYLVVERLMRKKATGATARFIEEPKKKKPSPLT